MGNAQKLYLPVCDLSAQNNARSYMSNISCGLYVLFRHSVNRSVQIQRKTVDTGILPIFTVYSQNNQEMIYEHEKLDFVLQRNEKQSLADSTWPQLIGDDDYKSGHSN